MSEIFESIKVSKEVSDSVDETVKILNIIKEESLKLETQFSFTELIINVAKRYKNES